MSEWEKLYREAEADRDKLKVENQNLKESNDLLYELLMLSREFIQDAQCPRIKRGDYEERRIGLLVRIECQIPDEDHDR